MGTTGPYHVPADRYYDRAKHVWAKPLTGGARVVAGIDTLGLEALGDLAYVKLAAVGTPVRRGDAIGTLEAAKMTSTVVAPVSGLVGERNERVLRDPTLVNRDPYGEGWLFAIDVTDWSAEAADLVHGDAVEPWVGAEIARYRAEGWIE